MLKCLICELISCVGDMFAEWYFRAKNRVVKWFFMKVIEFLDFLMMFVIGFRRKKEFILW